MITHFVRMNIAAAAVLLLLTAAHAGSQYVVVGAQPASDAIVPGRILNVGDTINVPQGTTVTLLGEDGSVNAIPGPANVTVTEEAVETNGADEDTQDTLEKRSTLAKIAGLLAGNNENADTLGVTRSFSDQPKPVGLDDPWAISVHGDGDGCLRDDTIILARATAKNRAMISADNGVGATLDATPWPAGEAQFDLGRTVPADSEEIEVRVNGKPALIRLHAVPDDLDQNNPVDVLGWMIAQACEGQALALMRQLTAQAQ